MPTDKDADELDVSDIGVDAILEAAGLDDAAVRQQPERVPRPPSDRAAPWESELGLADFESGSNQSDPDGFFLGIADASALPEHDPVGLSGVDPVFFASADDARWTAPSEPRIVGRREAAPARAASDGLPAWLIGPDRPYSSGSPAAIAEVPSDFADARATYAPGLEEPGTRDAETPPGAILRRPRQAASSASGVFAVPDAVSRASTPPGLLLADDAVAAGETRRRRHPTPIEPDFDPVDEHADTLPPEDLAEPECADADDNPTHAAIVRRRRDGTPEEAPGRDRPSTRRPVLIRPSSRSGTDSTEASNGQVLARARVATRVVRRSEYERGDERAELPGGETAELADGPPDTAAPGSTRLLTGAPPLHQLTGPEPPKLLAGARTPPDTIPGLQFEPPLVPPAASAAPPPSTADAEEEPSLELDLDFCEPPPAPTGKISATPSTAPLSPLRPDPAPLERAAESSARTGASVIAEWARRRS